MAAGSAGEGLGRAVRGMLLVVSLLGVAAPSAGFRLATVAKASGPCKGGVTRRTTIYVRSLADLRKRRLFPATTTVLMYISRSITVADTVDFGAAFSCTIFKADPALRGRMPSFTFSGNQKVLVRMYNLHNTMFMGIGFKQGWTRSGMPKCDWSKQNLKVPWVDDDWTCPALLMYRCYNVKIFKCAVSGRTDIYSSGAVEISYSTLQYDNDYSLSSKPSSRGWSWGTVRYAFCGDNKNLVRSRNRLVHSTITGSFTTVFIYMASVGIYVENNHISDFLFAGIQCGQGMQNVADCMMSVFRNNYIENTRGSAMDKDGAGIYYDLHWYNPGNLDTCNYILQTPHCYYIDYCSSGITIEGAVCINNGDGIKVNTGKFNVVRSVVLVRLDTFIYTAGFLSTQNWCENRCGSGKDQDDAMAWVTKYNTDFSNRLWKKNFPLLQNICGTMGYKFKGKYVLCNPTPPISNVTPKEDAPVPKCYDQMKRSSSTKIKYWSASAGQSGNCSGVPVLNSFAPLIFVTNMKTSSKFYGNLYKPYYLDPYPFGNAIEDLNHLNTELPKWYVGQLGFNNERKFDYGADNRRALVYRYYPTFHSCPRRKVGPKTAAFAVAQHVRFMYKTFNQHVPKWVLRNDPADYVFIAKQRLLRISEYAQTFAGERGPRDFRPH